MDKLKHSDITGAIIRSFYTVYNSLGYGFLEKVYENALLIELREVGLIVEQQKPINVFYKDQLVGEYFADLIVSNTVIVELKTAVTISRSHEAQLLNYLRATDIEVGLLLNFGPTAEYKRKIFDNEPTSI
ncbi:MAG: GxxExxY protein [Chloracidobacterium sp.]|nr:GxxExxY protein [Chloracidobacterium sp.]